MSSEQHGGEACGPVSSEEHRGEACGPVSSEQHGGEACGQVQVVPALCPTTMPLFFCVQVIKTQQYRSWGVIVRHS